MAKVTLRQGESTDGLIRRFKRKIEKEGTLIDIRKKDYYESPSVKKKKKHEAAIKRAAKAARKRAKAFEREY